MQRPNENSSARTQIHGVMLPVIPYFCPAGLEVAADPDDEHTIEYALGLAELPVLMLSLRRL